MRREVFPGGSYAEALPSGTYAVLRDGARVLDTSQGPLTAPSGGILYHRITEARGVLEIAGQAAQGDGQVVYWDGSTWNWSPAGIAYGISTAAYWPDGRLEISTIEKRYGSQGIRFITDRVYTGDETYGDPSVGLAEYTRHGDIAIGQGAQNGGVVIVRGAQRKRLSEGACYFVRFNRAGDQLAVAWWDVAGGRLSAHLAWLTVNEIATLPDDVVPQPEPEPEPEPMPEVPESIERFVKAERAKYPEVITAGTGARIISDAAIAADRAGFPGWGFSVKPGGNNVELPDGTRVAYDIMQNRLYASPADLWDVFRGQPEGEPFKGIVSWAQAHPHNDPNRPWHPPIGATLPPPDDGEPGEPPPVSGIADRAIMALIEAYVGPIHAAMQETIDIIQAKVDAIQIPEPGPAFPERIALRSDHGRYLVAEDDHSVNAGRESAGPWETWTVEIK